MNRPSTTPLPFLRACFATPARAVVSLIIMAGGAYAAIPFLNWAFLDAAWSGSTGADCEGKGACWIFIGMRFEQIIYGSYPADLRWRVDLAALLAVAGAGLSWATPARTGKIAATALFFAVYTVTAAILLHGGILGLQPVPTRLWGGLMLTAIIAAWTIATAVPLGLLLALARRSRLPLISMLAAVFVDTVRSLPLVGILFLAIVMFPFFMPPGVETDRLIRALAAFTLFNAANLAEVFRGGLQVVPQGQSEAGLALGLSQRQVTWKIVVPQAVFLSLPGVVNVCIAIVKETTIVLIVGLLDFLGVLQAGLSDPQWIAAEQARTTAYLFAAIVFWIVCFGLSTYSLRLEARMSPSHR
jgi:general L-amino acid transport system permease protein